MDRVEAWLMTCETRLREARRGWEDHARTEAEHAVDTLVAVGALSTARAGTWRRRVDEMPSSTPGSASPDQRSEAETFMRELLDACGADPEQNESALHRYEGASLLLSSTGLIDADAWDHRLRERAGWPSAGEEEAEIAELNRSASGVDLVSVIAGPEKRPRGFRVLFGLRFADGLTFVVDCDEQAQAIDWPEWMLRDSEGCDFVLGGGGGSDGQQHCNFRGAPSSDSAWVELELEDHPDVVFRMAL